MRTRINKLVHWLNEHSPFFLLTPTEFAIGNLSEEVFFGLLHARATKKKILILRRFSFFGTPVIANKELFKLQTPYTTYFMYDVLQFIGCLCLSLFYGHIPATYIYLKANCKNILKFWCSVLYNMNIKVITNYVELLAQCNPSILSTYSYQKFSRCFDQVGFGSDQIWNPASEKIFIWQAADQISWGMRYAQPMPIWLKHNKQKFAENQRQEMGLPTSVWYVCFHIREGGFRNDHHAVRNSNIYNCIPAMQEVIRRGGWVVRMGDASMKRLPLMNQVIDYPFTKFKSALMDLYLIQNCHFYVGMNSGILDCASLFQKQIILVNCTEWLISFPMRKNSLVIMKHVFSKELGRFLSIKELLTHELRWQDLNQSLKDFVIHENSSDEIQDVVLEALNHNQYYTHLQNEFIEKRKEYVTTYLLSTKQYSDDCNTQYRMLSRACSKATLGKVFLDKNWEMNQNNLKMPSMVLL